MRIGAYQFALTGVIQNNLAAVQRAVSQANDQMCIRDSQKADRGVRQGIAGKRTGVSDRVLPESGPEVSDRVLPESGPGCPTGYCQKADRRCPTGVPPGKSSHFGRNHPRREPKTGYVFSNPLV